MGRNFDFYKTGTTMRDTKDKGIFLRTFWIATRARTITPARTKKKVEILPKGHTAAREQQD